jgi:hypothetical protein
MALSLLTMLLGVGCGYAVGRVPPVVSAVDLQPVWVAQAEPSLGPALERALGEALARRVTLGSGPPVLARVTSFDEGPAMAGGTTWRVALSITVDLEGVGCVRESGVRTSSGGGHGQATAGRSAAVEALCQSLAENAVSRLLAGEASHPCP